MFTVLSWFDCAHHFFLAQQSNCQFNIEQSMDRALHFFDNFSHHFPLNRNLLQFRVLVLLRKLLPQNPSHDLVCSSPWKRRKGHNMRNLHISE